jgi:hypothetical protein
VNFLVACLYRSFRSSDGTYSRRHSINVSRWSYWRTITPIEYHQVKESRLTGVGRPSLNSSFSLRAHSIFRVLHRAPMVGFRSRRPLGFETMTPSSPMDRTSPATRKAETITWRSPDRRHASTIRMTCALCCEPAIICWGRKRAASSWPV